MHHQRLINQTWFMHLAFALTTIACIGVGGVLHVDKITAADWRSIFNDLLPTSSIVLVTAFWVYCGTKKASERREAAAFENVKKIEKQLSFLSSHLPAVVYLLDRNLMFTQVMGGEVDALELDPRDMIGMSLQEFLQLEDDHRILDNHRAVLAGATLRIEITLRKRDYLSIVKPLVDDDKINKGVMGFVFDITEQNDAITQLRDTEIQWRGIMDSMPGIIFQFALNENSLGKFNYVSSNSQSLLKVSSEKIVQNANALPLLFDKKITLSDKLIQAANVGAQLDIEGCFVDASGKQGRWRCQALPAPSSTKLHVIYNGILTDVTCATDINATLRAEKENAELRAAR